MAENPEEKETRMSETDYVRYAMRVVAQIFVVNVEAMKARPQAVRLQLLNTLTS